MDVEFPQALAVACAARLYTSPERPVVLIPEVLAVRSRTGPLSDRVQSLWVISGVIEGEPGATPLQGLVLVDCDPDESARWLSNYQPVFLVKSTAEAQPVGLVIHGELDMAEKGPNGDRGIAELRALISQFVEPPAIGGARPSRRLH